MIRRNLFLSLGLASVVLFSSCKEDAKPEEEIIEENIEFTKEGELSLIKAEGDTIKKIDIEIADSQYEHETGLMYRDSMEDSQGMLFIYEDAAPRAFYMKNTYIPLDIIYYSSDSTAISFYENAKPMDETSLPSGEPAQFILEINGGLIEEWNIEVGDKIYFERID
ncbi:MAG TPA: DUF192 domain-containing protein [Salegentibacter sp.]|nr:DUF192 domain-containing protein [Salegentibacter sp.]